jgi:hypothetical protein
VRYIAAVIMIAVVVVCVALRESDEIEARKQAWTEAEQEVMQSKAASHVLIYQ